MMVRAKETQHEGLKEGAEKLLEVSHSALSPIRLTPRESDVLDEVLHNSGNKEIAHALSISERTAKFYVLRSLQNSKFVTAWRSFMSRGIKRLERYGNSLRPISRRSPWFRRHTERHQPIAPRLRRNRCRTKL